VATISLFLTSTCSVERNLYISPVLLRREQDPATVVAVLQVLLGRPRLTGQSDHSRNLALNGFASPDHAQAIPAQAAHRAEAEARAPTAIRSRTAIANPFLR